LKEAVKYISENVGVLLVDVNPSLKLPYLLLQEEELQLQQQEEKRRKQKSLKRLN